MSKTISIPLSFDQAYEGERVRPDDLYMECGGNSSRMVELVTIKSMEDVEDGRIDIIDLDINDVFEKTSLPLAIVIEVAGRHMQQDYEPVLEKQIHRIINRMQGIMHIGQRDIASLRVSKSAVKKGFRLRHIGIVLHDILHHDFERIIDRIQVKLYTEENKVAEITAMARDIYALRDARIEGMTDEDTDMFYSCTICQSHAPYFVCTISPQRSSPCGSYNWMDCKASYNIDPTGPSKPISKGLTLDSRLGQWQGVNEFILKASQGKTDHYNLYSIIDDPMTSCEGMECISAILPLCNGIMTANKEYSEMTPCGMNFATLTDNISGELNTPGFMGHSKYNISQGKFISAEGGIKRITWMPEKLKKDIAARFNARAKEIGIPDLIDRIADESTGTTEEEILLFLKEKKHPALSMEPIIQL